MSAQDHLGKQFAGYPKSGNEGLDRAAREGSHMLANPAAKQEQDFNMSYGVNHPRPKGAVNVTQPGA